MAGQDTQSSALISVQTDFWNGWNASHREKEIGEISRDQRRVVLGWLERTVRTDLDIIEVGCGSGWLCPSLKQFGRVTATDLSDQVLARARARIPQVEFVAGDFMDLDLAAGAFDVAVNLEVLSHVADQPAFVRKLASLLRPQGLMMLATQNRPVLQRFNSKTIHPAGAGQLRRWVDAPELRSLLSLDFDVLELFSVTPRASQGLMRLVSGHKARQIARAVVGERFERLKERMGLGWTLMCLAQKRTA